MKVAIQGEPGSFHHEATEKWYGANVEIVPAESFGGVFAALKNSTTNAAIVAIENSLYGSINEVLDLMEKYNFPITGEIFLQIEQQLIVLPGAKLDDITRVYSHPVALAQCEKFLMSRLPNAEKIEHHDTAASVEFIKNLNDPTAAAIAGRTVAELHSLPILVENIEDDKANFTRFLVLDPKHAVENPDKFSLILITDHAAGALAKCLEVFAAKDANLTKLESRPIIGHPWRYKFYIDLETDEVQFEKAKQVIEKDGAQVTVLGKYRSATL